MEITVARARSNIKRINFRITEKGKQDRIGIIIVPKKGVYDIKMVQGHSLSSVEERKVINKANFYMEQIENQYENGEIEE
ncbi:hypothetical protein [Halobacillus yeomjeoni]|uniref:Uncharacterized protein n=1 Tax=Halobacillus yeomjeoni TaxID=311194 RepID=A0A931HTM6_9BACI|nr:hypothetical protein [Halobacillus yeomjeoni]MBH0229535.1 hypothetical protein [Halobacillus yeomjeoni]